MHSGFGGASTDDTTTGDSASERSGQSGADTVSGHRGGRETKTLVNNSIYDNVATLKRQGKYGEVLPIVRPPQQTNPNIHKPIAERVIPYSEFHQGQFTSYQARNRHALEEEQHDSADYDNTLYEDNVDQVLDQAIADDQDISPEDIYQERRLSKPELRQFSREPTVIRLSAHAGGEDINYQNVNAAESVTESSAQMRHMNLIRQHSDDHNMPLRAPARKQLSTSSADWPPPPEPQSDNQTPDTPGIVTAFDSDTLKRMLRCLPEQGGMEKTRSFDYGTGFRTLGPIPQSGSSQRHSAQEPIESNISHFSNQTPLPNMCEEVEEPSMNIQAPYREQSIRDRKIKEQALREKAEIEQAQKEKAQREKAQREQAQKEQLQKELAQRDQAHRDLLQRELVQREKAQREQAQREKAQREREREQAIMEKAQREQAQREQAQREQAQREQAQREQAQHEQAQREQAQREQAQREQAQLEQAQREQAQREQALRDQAQREQEQREQAQREHEQREQAQREQAQHEQAQREQAQREQAQREQLQREQTKREQEQRAQAQREQAQKEKLAQRDRSTAIGNGVNSVTNKGQPPSEYKTIGRQTAKQKKDNIASSKDSSKSATLPPGE